MNKPDFQHMIRREVEDYLIEKSLVDPEFRSRLIARPAQTLAELGLPVGEKADIKVMVERSGAFYIVLPHVLRESHEIDAEELEGISGGLGIPHTGQEQFFGGYA